MFFLTFMILLQRAEQKPLVITQSSLRWNATNEMLIIAYGSSNNLVDIYSEVVALQSASVIFRQTLQAKIAGSINRVKFFVPDGTTRSSFYRVLVRIQGDSEPFEKTLPGLPDLRFVYLRTDKIIYKPNEIVRVRALLLTANGKLYNGTVVFSLVNPDGFELSRKTKPSPINRFHAVEFHLPEHLNFGKWKVVAYAANGKESNSYSTSFYVQNYALLPFHVHIIGRETDNIDIYELNVLASYANGRPISGRLSVQCECNTNDDLTNESFNVGESSPCILTSSEITSGYWSKQVNIERCSGSSTTERTNLVKLTAEVLDHGTGNRIKNDVEIDFDAANLELIPLRPGYNRGSANIMVLVKSLETKSSTKLATQAVVVDIRCISVDKNQTLILKSYDTEIDSFITISATVDLYEHSCRVLLIQARRKIGQRLSHAVLLALPSFDNSKWLQQDWIQWSPPSFRNGATYRIGEKLKASVPMNLAEEFNYIVMCQDETIVEAGRVRDDGNITIEITAAMVPFCMLYVFRANETVQADVILFFVEQSCKNSLAVSNASIEVGNNLTLILSSSVNSLILLSAVDIHMLELVQQFSSRTTAKYWKFSVEQHSHSSQTLFLNWADPKVLIDEIRKICGEAGVLLMLHLKRCPNFMKSSSAISDECLRSLILACECLNTSASTSTVCDRKTEHGCAVESRSDNSSGPSLKLASMHFLMTNTRTRNRTRLDDSTAASAGNRKSIDLSTVIRQYFPEVWLFEDMSLGALGLLNVTVRVPDSVTQWYLKSSAWAPGDLMVCDSAPSIVKVEKKLFLNAEFPKHVYVNESIIARISVFAVQLQSDLMLSVCMTELDRHVCGDVGIQGERGQPAYTRIHLTPTTKTSTKIFTLRFLRTGETQVIFTLKEEISYPGRYHCDVGKVYDAVKLKIFVAKRAETEEHYKRLVLNPVKPSHRLTRHPDLSYSLFEIGTEHGKKKIIDYNEYRTKEEPQKLITNISINVPNTDAVSSTTIDLSHFLIEGLITDPVAHNEINSQSNDGRWERNAISNQKLFQTDVISSFSSTLYHFKSLNFFHQKMSGKLELFDDAIGSLMSAMLTFSNCGGGSVTQTCAFSNVRKTRHPTENSFFLTVLSTSLLCEGDVDERIICPLLSYLLNVISISMDAQFPSDHFLDYLDFLSEDRIWLIKAMVNQLSTDCAAYQCVRRDSIWIRLRESFFNLSDYTRFDVRTMAALAFMAPRPVSNIMRIKMYSIAKDGMLPYWSAGRITNNSLLLNNPSRFSDLLKCKMTKSGDLLANSLGLLAFVSRGVNPVLPVIELDLLADWIYEQLNENEEAPSALDAYFANRAIYEYRIRRTNRQSSGNCDRVTILCEGCKSMVHNVTNTPAVFYLPTTVRNITLITEGDMKVRVGIRVLTTKRMHMSRGLDQNFYPTIITVAQHMDSPGAVRQEVCLRILSPMIDLLEVTHGLFTGFTSQDSLFRILPNTTAFGVRLVDQIAISTFAVHFVLTELKPQIPLCYEIGITEPKNTYEPDQLAPIAIIVRHPIYDIIGQELVSYVERFKRSPLEEAIDMVCWDGSCSCAEASCTVQCSQCFSISKEHLHRELCDQNMFGSTVEIEDHKIETLRGSEYFVIDVSLKHWRQNGAKTALLKPERIEVWLRTCNVRCAKPKVGDTYYFSGNTNAIVVDFNARMHYVLRENDRWELASEECGHLFSYLITSRPCFP